MKKLFFSIILIVGLFAATNVYSDQTVSIRNKEGKILNTTVDKIKPQSKEESAINVRLKNNVSENQKQVVLEKLKRVKNSAVTQSVKDKAINK
jgi:hypothetical protein